MPFVSIRSRLIFLAALLLAILAVASALLSGQLIRASDDLAEQAKLVSIVKNANSASKHFGDLKYWITDSAKTLFVRSQQNADAAKARLDLDLKAIAPVDPAGVAAIGGEVDTLTELARKAAEAYSSDDSAGGNALMQQAQTHVLNVDREIEQIVDRSEQHALARRDASMRQAETAVNVSVAGGIITLVVALSLTALIVRSINAPLRRLEHSMAAITRGELDATIPPPGRDEIGAMTSALGMLRDSLIERDRLERDRQRAEAEIRAARDAAEAALTELKAAQANLIQAEKMASLGQLTAGIAHEIKNPLNFVNNFAALSTELLDELKQTTGPAVAALDSDGRAEAEEVMATLAGNLQKIIEHGNRADNIVKTRDLGEAVEVRVRDNGTGIPPEIRDKLFQPFFTTKPTGEGTGLGLSISYDIITQQHGGTIEVDSEPGAFTEFTIRLPR
jgi:signal transduction histidine kinase